MSYIFEKVIVPEELTTRDAFFRCASPTDQKNLITYLLLVKKFLLSSTVLQSDAYQTHSYQTHIPRDIVRSILLHIAEPQFVEVDPHKTRRAGTAPVDLNCEFPTALEYTTYWLSHPAAQKYNPLICCIGASSVSAASPTQQLDALVMIICHDDYGRQFMQELVGPTRVAKILDRRVDAHHFETAEEISLRGSIDRYMHEQVARPQLFMPMPQRKRSQIKTLHVQIGELYPFVIKSPTLRQSVQPDDNKDRGVYYKFTIPRYGEYLLGITIDDSELPNIDSICITAFSGPDAFKRQIDLSKFISISVGKIVDPLPKISSYPCKTYHMYTGGVVVPAGLYFGYLEIKSKFRPIDFTKLHYVFVFLSHHHKHIIEDNEYAEVYIKKHFVPNTH